MQQLIPPPRQPATALNRASKRSPVFVEANRNGLRAYTVNDDGMLAFEEETVSLRQVWENALGDYLLPAGYPDSCAPQLSSYMIWRGVQYFFGGALSVLTTRSLLTSLGVANKHAPEASAAINWVIKDGAGRMGRFLFARIGGRSLDDSMKQWRLLGDGLMFMGATVEISTSLAPAMFLPLACSANLAKNLAAVAASATRAPIYRTFAKQNNLADITAKAESVANLSDVLGTACGILLTRKVSTLPAFIGLSIGYLFASRKEVDTVELDYFNSARLGVACKQFLSTGTCPTIKECNLNEPLLPWISKNGHSSRIILGASVAEACHDSPEALERAIADSPSSSNYLVTYRHDTKKAYVVLKKKAGHQASYEGCFAAELLLHVLSGGDLCLTARSRIQRDFLHLKKAGNGTNGCREFERGAARFVSKHGHELFVAFDRNAQSMNWKTALNTLNTKDNRLLQ
jgi:hypothetical protein